MVHGTRARSLSAAVALVLALAPTPPSLPFTPSFPDPCLSQPLSYEPDTNALKEAEAAEVDDDIHVRQLRHHF